MGMESQLHGPSTFCYQGKGAAFGQINPLLRSLLQFRLFSYETMYSLINTAKHRAPKSQVQDKYLYLRGKMDHRKTETNNLVSKSMLSSCQVYRGIYFISKQQDNLICLFWISHLMVII